MSGHKGEAELVALFQGNGGLAVLSPDIGEHLPAANPLAYQLSLFPGGDTHDGGHVSSQLQGFVAALYTFFHLGFGIRVGASDQDAVGTFQSFQGSPHFGVIVFPGQKLGGALHAAGILQLHSRRAGPGDTLYCPVHAEGPAKAVFNVHCQGDMGHITDAAYGPFQFR